MASREASEVLRVGAAQVDITPPFPTHVAGSGAGEYRPASFVEDPLFARALVMEAKGRKLGIVSLDVTIVTREWTERIRQAAQEQCGLEPESLMVHATQTHSAPSLGYFMLDETIATPPELEWLRGSESRYFEFAFERIVEAIVRADEVRQPVRWAVGRGIEGRIAFNRRAVTREGRVMMPPRRWQDPLGPTWMLYLEGPIDPEVGVVAFQSPSLEMLAFLLHYTCHPVNVFPKPIISADWPGAWAQEVQQRWGPRSVPLVLNGCCGNINPWGPFEPHHESNHRRMGQALAEVTERVLETLSFREGAVLDYRTEHLPLPIREVEPALLQEAQSLLAEHPSPPRRDDGSVEPSWLRAASILSVHRLRQRTPTLDYEIQVLRIGDVALVGLPGEPFFEGQLRIKLASPFPFTYPVHCVNHYVGYLPTREAFAHGGHEVETRYWAKLTPEALDRVVETALRLLREMHGEHREQEGRAGITSALRRPHSTGYAMTLKSASLG